MHHITDTSALQVANPPRPPAVAARLPAYPPGRRWARLTKRVPVCERLQASGVAADIAPCRRRVHAPHVRFQVPVRKRAARRGECGAGQRDHASGRWPRWHRERCTSDRHWSLTACSVACVQSRYKRRTPENRTAPCSPPRRMGTCARRGAPPYAWPSHSASQTHCCSLARCTRTAAHCIPTPPLSEPHHVRALPNEALVYCCP